MKTTADQINIRTRLTFAKKHLDENQDFWGNILGLNLYYLKSN